MTEEELRRTIKCTLAMMVDAIIRRAIENGLPEPRVDVIVEEQLVELAAVAHLATDTPDARLHELLRASLSFIRNGARLQ